MINVPRTTLPFSAPMTATFLEQVAQALSPSPSPTADPSLEPVADDSTQSAGDAQLTRQYASALQTPVLYKHNLNPNKLTLNSIPPDSHFGQWRTHLHNILGGRAMRHWAAEKNIALPANLMINASMGTLTSRSENQLRTSGIDDFPGWPLLINAARMLTPNGGVVTSGEKNAAQLLDISMFYGTPVPFDASKSTSSQEATIRAYADKILEGPALSYVDSHNPSKQDLSFQKLQLADMEERFALGMQLEGSVARQLAALSGPNAFSTAEQRAALFTSAQLEVFKETPFSVERGSSYVREHGLSDGANVSLHRYLLDKGIPVPSNHDELMSVAEALRGAPPVKPPLGDLGGALSSSAPLSTEDQRKLHSAIRHYLKDSLDDNLFKCWTRNLSTVDGDPHRLLAEILGTSQARWMGHIAEEHLGKLPSRESLQDWMLAALQLSLEQSPSLFSPNSKRTESAGFDFAHAQLSGQSASSIKSLMADHLVLVKKATPRTAPLAVAILLSRKAPHLLVRDIPEQVKFGSHTWVSFSTAVARIEAQAPGSTSKMTFAQVMQRADQMPVFPEERHAARHAHDEALKDWGVANGIIEWNREDTYTDAQMTKVRGAFNEQVTELNAASTAFATQMPEFQKMGLKKLQQMMPHLSLEDLQEKYITRDTAHHDSPGPYSVLDLYLTNRLRPTDLEWRASHHKISLPAIRATLSTQQSSLSELKADFERAFHTFVDNYETAIATQTKNLISSLPLADREIIEYGALAVAKEVLVVSHSFTGVITNYPRSESKLILHSVHNDKVHVYEVDYYNNTVRKREDLSGLTPGSQKVKFGKQALQLLPVTPAGTYTENLLNEHGKKRIPESYFSERTRYIADAKLKIADMGSYKKMAEGLTTFDTEVSINKKVGEFFLNLVPLYSAVTHFTKGNIGAGIVDLALDGLGFFVGFGAAAKGAKALKAGASTFRHAARGVKILGRATLSAVNPLDGVGALLGAVGAGGKQLASHGARQFTEWAMAGAYKYDLLKKVFGNFDAGAIGTAKINGEIAEVAAVTWNAKWYALDPFTMKPHGLPLNDFLPSPRLEAEALGKWNTASDPVSKISDDVINKWNKIITHHRSKIEFDNGYRIGDVDTVPRLSSAKKRADFMKLAAKPGLSSEQLGVIVRKFDEYAYTFGKRSAFRFVDNIEPRFGSVVPMPQVSYIGMTSQLSDGQCAAISRLMATAMEEGKDLTLIRNMYTAAAFPADPACRRFIEKLNKLQLKIQTPTAFYATKKAELLSYQDIVKKLDGFTSTRSIMIDSPGHAIAAGVKIEDGKKTFWFNEPNYGLATFDDADLMTRGLDKHFRDKKLDVQYKTHGTDRTKLEFKVFDHDNEWRKVNSVFDSEFNDLYKTPLTPSGQPISISHRELAQTWEKLHLNPDNQAFLCYDASLRVAQAEKTISPKAFDVVMAAIDLKGTSNYSSRYLELMDIKPGSQKALFNPEDITESGFLNFKHAHKDGEFGHTVYIQKTNNNELYLFNTNSYSLDAAMLSNNNPFQIHGGLTVYNITGDKHKGLQDFLNGFGGDTPWEFAFTPASTLNANIKKLTT
ncbi:hypothetical protein [Pseudomonas sp.]|uniref:hypothetical protein n=1 Tax=Pseudomonas sp. TaxID=306 RepID=UPI00261BECB9|nr:hypothetical protein [Pseudomonas sp.]